MMALKQMRANAGANEARANEFYSRQFRAFSAYREAARPQYEGMANLILERWPKNTMEVLDVGCGDGYLASLLMERVAANFHLLDQSEEAVKLARVQAPSALEIINTDLKGYLEANPGGNYDVILAINSLYSMTLNWEFADKLMSQLKEGGKLMLVLATGRSQFSALRKKYWSKVNDNPLDEKNVFDDAVRVFGGERRIVSLRLETANLAIEQCERIAQFILYTESLAEPVRQLAKELKELDSVGIKYGFLCATKRPPIVLYPFWLGDWSRYG